MAEDDQTAEASEPKWFRDRMEKQEAENKTLRDQLATLTKDRVFTDAGIPAEKVGKLFREAYTGELSVDAIKAAATEYGILEPLPDKTPEPDQGAHQRIFEAAATEDRVQVPQAQAEALLTAKNQDELNAAMKALGIFHEATFG